ncbi:MAG: class I SAM-dependent methyltransferase, partial [Gammaproteobacteria bacterium]|nr:class I SAM-dependent methyltransferase [Gammaproteobacteria bacterium]
RRNLGAALLLQGRADEAVDVYLEIDHALPASPELRREFAAAARYLVPRTRDPRLERAVLECLGAADANPQALAHLAARLVCLKHGLDGRGAAASGDPLAAFMGDPLLRKLLMMTVNVEPALERTLTEARRQLLKTYVDADSLDADLVEFLSALAQQCFSNEYVFAETADEQARVAIIVERLKCALAGAPTSGDRLVAPMLLVSLYRPLCLLPVAIAIDALPDTAWPGPVASLIERTLSEPLEEARLAESIPAATGISDATSEEVRAQYEANPYPRWFGLPLQRRESYAAMLRRRFAHFEPPSRLEQEAEVLVLGCGTGQEAVAAAGRLARVTGVDLSRASLAYALRMARRHGLQNLEFLQADALNLRDLGRRFDVIESSGVLHHLSDPMAGWRAAVDCLEPGGVMKIGLYSERARKDVVTARESIAARGHAADPEGIRAFRRSVLEAPPDDALSRLAGSEDFYTMSSCRDLLFHVCEHHFSPRRIGGALEELGLVFLGFELPHAVVRSRYRSFNPDDQQMTDLDAWERFEEAHPDVFAAMYVFWCHKPG